MNPILQTIKTILFAGVFLHAQPGLAQFHLNGSAYRVNDSCFVLTTDKASLAGSIWHMEKVDLRQSFRVSAKIRFGCKDKDGADGIVFAFQPTSTALGVEGGWLGYRDISPSVGIEFDTWENDLLDDPPFDHVAMVKNGNLYHQSSANLAGPVMASASSANIEDCKWHGLLVLWDAPSHTLSVSFDCQQRLSYTGDLVGEIFGGKPEVYWGFTASTGGATNLQEICLEQQASFVKMEDITLCPGGQFQLDAGFGKTFKWLPAMGLSDPGIADPIASPEQTTVYSVEISDECGGIRRDTVTIFVEGDSLSLDLGDDTLLCEGQSMLLDAALPVAGNVVYAWSNGATVPALSVTGQGLYAVTVTVDDFCVASDKVAVSLLFLPNPLLPKDTLLCTGQSVEFDATVPGGSAYRWQDGSELPVLYANTAGVYSVEVTNACGKNSASVRVEIEECRQVYFPNAFSPNGDGINDVFLPFDSGDVEQVQSLEIFSRWGGEVFGAYRFLPNDFSQGWDGRKGGRKAPPGVYVWRAEVRFRNGVSKHLAGDVLLTR